MSSPTLVVDFGKAFKSLNESCRVVAFNCKSFHAINFTHNLIDPPFGVEVAELNLIYGLATPDSYLLEESVYLDPGEAFDSIHISSKYGDPSFLTSM